MRNGLADLREPVPPCLDVYGRGFSADLDEDQRRMKATALMRMGGK
jgi:hypothetical protein